MERRLRAALHSNDSKQIQSAIDCLPSDKEAVRANVTLMLMLFMVLSYLYMEIKREEEKRTVAAAAAANPRIKILRSLESKVKLLLSLE